jgi:hypothetical protein
MKALFIAFCLLFSNSSAAFDASAIYNEKLSNKETGIYEESGYLFFIINQVCLTEKKFSGTKESKAAELAFYILLSETAKRYNLSFDKTSIQFAGKLQTAIYENISMNDNALSKITHQLVFDRNSKNKACTREYVKISSLENFGKNKVKISKSQVLNIAADLLFEAVIEEDSNLVAEYLLALNLPRLAEVYQIKRETNSYPFNLSYGDFLKKQHKCVNEKYCVAPPPPLNKYDINSVIATVFKEKGLLKLTATNPSVELSNDFFTLANNDFEQGTNAEGIIKNLIISINLNNQNSKAWKMLSTIYRALNSNDEALMAAIQYAIQSEEQIEPWVYLLKTLQPVAPQEAKRLHELLVLITHKIKLTSWAQSQIKDYQ